MSRVRWECPNGCAGVLGSSRPRQDDVVRYCLECSGATGRLVQRHAPALERKRAARKARRAEQAEAKKRAEQRRADQHHTVGGLDLREVLRVAWRLPTAREMLRRPFRTQMVQPGFTVKRVKAIRARTGQAHFYRHHIDVFVEAKREYEGAMLGDLVDTVLHEVAHLVLGHRPGAVHDHVFKALLGSLRVEYIAIGGPGASELSQILAPSCGQPSRDQDEDCEHCDGTGHRDGCESREPAFDLGDLVCRAPCNGCCPDGCEVTGLQQEQDEASEKTRKLLGAGE